MNTMEYKGLTISPYLWIQLMYELKVRGKGTRESGAFLLGNENSRKIKKWVCYDDLDPNALHEGMIKFSSTGYVNLSKLCKNLGLVALGDVHTHPSDWTFQSVTDINNPMFSLPGYVSIIVPNYAKSFLQLRQGIGYYTYLGNYKWKTEKSQALRFNIL